MQVAKRSSKMACADALIEPCQSAVSQEHHLSFDSPREVDTIDGSRWEMGYARYCRQVYIASIHDV
jgi:hypothetical protein